MCKIGNIKTLFSCNSAERKGEKQKKSDKVLSNIFQKTSNILFRKKCTHNFDITFEFRPYKLGKKLPHFINIFLVVQIHLRKNYSRIAFVYLNLSKIFRHDDVIGDIASSYPPFIITHRFI